MVRHPKYRQPPDHPRRVQDGDTQHYYRSHGVGVVLQPRGGRHSSRTAARQQRAVGPPGLVAPVVRQRGRGEHQGVQPLLDDKEHQGGVHPLEGAAGRHQEGPDLRERGRGGRRLHLPRHPLVPEVQGDRATARARGHRLWHRRRRRWHRAGRRRDGGSAGVNGNLTMCFIFQPQMTRITRILFF